ncbi:recombination protein RecR [Candidatus Saccharibacteria bacterium]|nr:recombination protein RecR [Candidatus Saccharibacteria bacterium]MBJ58365.1 recombination protein RecR [Candidatus Saccharibacteria bacterium]MBQ69037.1 recombination protein RecR [Candidatus Saccharibacteria bacterium]|tara:strand:+ start:3492 stop:4109 length:618 start_codon:yes stop_codon:yes gene_type:complete
MARLLPSALEKLIDELGRLPGVGSRTAERYAYYLLRSDQRINDSLSHAIHDIHHQVKTCPVTFALIDADQEISPLYADSDRDKTLIAVVEEPLDIVAIERTGQYKGTYHVLGGAISPIDGVGPEQLHIPELVQRIQADGVTEIIIATNASVEGESTALFLQKYLKDADIDIIMSRLARGIPVGVDLEYADQITLSHALEGRRSLN